MIISTEYRSNNFDARPSFASIDTLVLHDTHMTSAEVALKRLCDNDSKVSCHYVISKEGQVFQLVDEENRAWHAGKSSWRGRSALNDFSIGIELDNNGAEHFLKDQMKSLKILALDIIKRRNIPAHNIVAHADIAYNRKDDPNAFFNWGELAECGIGIYSDMQISDNSFLFKPDDIKHEILELKGRLKKFGYYIENMNCNFDKELYNLIHAFKRRFVPETYHINFWDKLSDLRLNELLK